MALMGLREYARHRGCHLRAVQKAIEAGRIELVEDARGKKKVDADKADLAWRLNTDIAKQSLLYAAPAKNTSESAASFEGGVAEAAIPPCEPASQTPGSSAAKDEPLDENKELYTANRAQREAIARERAQMELDELKGNLIKLDQAMQVAFTSFRMLRDSLLNVPARLKDALAMESDAFQVEHMLEAELGAVLSSFDPERALTGLDEGDDDDDGAQSG